MNVTGALEVSNNWLSAWILHYNKYRCLENIESTISAFWTTTTIKLTEKRSRIIGGRLGSCGSSSCCGSSLGISSFVLARASFGVRHFFERFCFGSVLRISCLCGRMMKVAVSHTFLRLKKRKKLFFSDLYKLQIYDHNFCFLHCFNPEMVKGLIFTLFERIVFTCLLHEGMNLTRWPERRWVQEFVKYLIITMRGRNVDYLEWKN
jgi:hypothetical protein